MKSGWAEHENMNMHLPLSPINTLVMYKLDHTRLKSFILRIKDSFHQRILCRMLKTFADNFESN